MSDLTRPERCVALRDARERVRKEGGCRYCRKRLEGSMKQVWCSVGIEWKHCKTLGEKSPFELDDEVVNGSR